MTGTEKSASFWQRWMRRPQSTWLRKAMFQLHVWAGIILGLYIVVVCVSGSAIVFRNDIYDTFESWSRAGASGWRVETMHFGYIVLRWVSDLHGKLLLGSDGMMWNAIGGFLTAALSVTGLVIWWPGSGKWRRGLTARLRPARGGAVADSGRTLDGESDPAESDGPGARINWKRYNFDLHSAVGFWTFGILFVWGMTGGYFVFPEPFRAVIEIFTPINAPPLRPPVVQQTPQAANLRLANPAPTASNLPPSAPTLTLRRPRRPLTLGGKILRDFSFAHYGNFGGWPVKTLWAILGLTPAVLFGTALIMWWNRVLSPIARRWRREWESEPDRVKFPSPEMGD